MEDKTFKELSGQDFIMNNEVLGIIKKYLTEDGGKPEKVVEALSGGYNGYSNMCNLLGDWTNILSEDTKKRKERDLNEIENENLNKSSNFISLNSNKRLKQSRDGGDYQTNISLLIKNKIKEMIISKFDTKKADTIFEKGENSTLVWLDFMIEHEHWRKLLYELSEKNSDSLMLNFAIQRVSEAGYQMEIASLSTASTFFPVFNKVLQQTLQTTFSMDDLQLSLHLPLLLKMCCHSQHTYFYSQLLLSLLLPSSSSCNTNNNSNNNDNENTNNNNDNNNNNSNSNSDYNNNNVNSSYNLRSLFFNLRDCALEKEPNLVFKIHQSIDHQLFQFSSLSQALSNIFLSKKTNFSDILKIEKEYHSSSSPSSSSSSSSPSSSSTLKPSVKYIRDPLFLKILIEDLFNPKSTINEKNLNKYFYLLSYASVVEETISKDGNNEKGCINNSHHDDGDYNDNNVTKDLGDKEDKWEGEKKEGRGESKEEKELIKETMNALQFSHNLCKLNLFDQDFQRSLPTLTNHLKLYPVVSAGILHWVQLSLLEESDSGTISLSLPYLLLLIRFICFYQPLQRDQVISIIERAFDKERPSFDVLASVNFRKKLLNTLLYVLRCGHVVQVLNCIQKLAERHDSSLIRIFLELVMQITEPPFSHIFLKYMLDLISISMPSDLSSLQSWEEKVTPFLNLIPSHLLENDFNLLFNQIKSSFSPITKSFEKINLKSSSNKIKIENK